MIVAYFESIKYVGHLLPIAFFRMFIGYYYFNFAMDRLRGDYLDLPVLASELSQWLPSSTAPEWYKYFVETVVIPDWQYFATMATVGYLAIGLSFLIGYLVRPLGLLGVFLSLNMAILANGDIAHMNKFLFVVNFTLVWLGSGRCLGLDYFFFKRKRGIWW